VFYICSFFVKTDSTCTALSSIISVMPLKARGAGNYKSPRFMYILHV